MCGLSANQPFCDGSHKRTRDEEEGKTYLYDEEGHRTEITNESTNSMAPSIGSRLLQESLSRGIEGLYQPFQ